MTPKPRFFVAAAIAEIKASRDLTPAQKKQAIDSLALEKVRDLSKYISIIGDKQTPWSDAQRVIESIEALDADVISIESAPSSNLQSTKSIGIG